MSSPTRPADHELPAVDDHIVMPESGYEIDDGKLVRVSPALEPHAERHSQLVALLEAHVADDYKVAIDLLTRISETTDRAPDISVYPRARDPRTGGRQLEQLAFEIVSTEALSECAKKASDLSQRGVRRVFAIDVERSRAFEWSRELGTWGLLDPNGMVEDATLAVPLAIEVFVRAIKADDAMVRAFMAKRHPLIVSALAESNIEGRIEGRIEGKLEAQIETLADGILSILDDRELTVSATTRERIERTSDTAQLKRWLIRAGKCIVPEDLFTDD